MNFERENDDYTPGFLEGYRNDGSHLLDGSFSFMQVWFGSWVRYDHPG
ncbi:MAG: hypothetical protein V1766_06430 [Pseudomonadota bacterium]